jgi:hypothetical protein
VALECLPVPAVTLISIRSDLALKLEQLEVRAAVLERDAREALPFELSQRPVPLSQWVLSAVTAALGSGTRLARGATTWLGSVIHSPRLTFALRVVRGRLYDAVLCVVATGVVLLAVAVALLVVAPPD